MSGTWIETKRGQIDSGRLRGQVKQHTKNLHCCCCRGCHNIMVSRASAVCKRVGSTQKSFSENVDRMTKTTIITWNICLGNRSYLLRRGLIILLEFNEHQAESTVFLTLCRYVCRIWTIRISPNDNYHATNSIARQSNKGTSKTKEQMNTSRSTLAGQIGPVSCLCCLPACDLIFSTPVLRRRLPIPPLRRWWSYPPESICCIEDS